MNKLIIDASSNREIKVGLVINSEEDVLIKEIGEHKAQAVLPMINDLLKKDSLELADINEIEVNTGPGSFTGLRVGIAVANALAFALKIPVNGKEIGKFVEPVY